MDIVVPKKELIRQIATCYDLSRHDYRAKVKLVDKPALHDRFLLTAQGGAPESLTLTSTNVRHHMSSMADVDIRHATNGREFVVVPANRFAWLVSAMPDGPLRIRRSGTSVVLSAVGTKRELVVDASVRPDEFPEADTELGNSRLLFVKEDLLRIVEGAEHAISRDASRAHINSLLLDWEHSAGGALFRTVAADGHRIVLCKSRSVLDAGNEPFPHRSLVPLDAVGSLIAMLRQCPRPESQVAVTHNGKTMTFAADRAVLRVQLTDSLFPPWEQFVPTKWLTKTRIPRMALVSAIEAVFMTNRSGSTGLRPWVEKTKRSPWKASPSYKDTQVRISVGSAGVGATLKVNGVGDHGSSSHDEVPVAHTGKPFSSAFEATYLLAALRAMQGGEVLLRAAPHDIGPHAFWSLDGEHVEAIMRANV